MLERGLQKPRVIYMRNQPTQTVCSAFVTFCSHAEAAACIASFDNLQDSRITPHIIKATWIRG